MSLLNYFPLDRMREKQHAVLLEIESAIKSGYKNIFLEAPAGFGKSPVAITLARYLGSSHICTATKDLQAQYRRDFPFVLDVKGRGNFPCIVKEDMGIDETCDYGPCVQDENYDCAFKTRLLDYDLSRQGTTQELIRINPLVEKSYVDKLKRQSKLVELSWRPCHYFHQKWMGAKASHTVYNYRYFLSDIFYAGTTQKRKLLVFDEAHQLESEVGDFRSFTVTKNALRFLPRLQMPEKKTEDLETWIDFLSNLQDKLLKFIETATDAIELGRSADPYTERNLVDAISREKNLSSVLYDVRSSKKNWIVSSIHRDGDGSILRATLTPLATAGYFGEILDKGAIAFFMSATILSKEYLCKVAGIKPDAVRFIQVSESDFPVENRPIRLMNVAWLSAKTMHESMPRISKAIDNIMSMHKKEKGIIHTTSYTQLQFIRDNLSRENASRLIETGSSIAREEVIAKHTQSSKPTVLISPSLHLGVDLKDDLSRFQVIVKVPYPDLTDRKVLAMKERDPRWYTWYTVLRLAQSYGRCLSQDTQILTRTGWKGKDEICIGEEVLGLDSRYVEGEKGSVYRGLPKLQWAPVVDIHKFETDKTMVSIKGDGVDALVTPDHTMIVIPRNLARDSQKSGKDNSSITDLTGFSQKMQKVAAKDLPSVFCIPVAGYLPAGGGHDRCRIGKIWAEVMGLVLGNGGAGKSNRDLIIPQPTAEARKQQQIIRRVERLFETLELPYERKMYEAEPKKLGYSYGKKGKINTWLLKGRGAEKIRNYIMTGSFLQEYEEVSGKNNERGNERSDVISNGTSSGQRKIWSDPGVQKSMIPWWILSEGTGTERQSLLAGLMLGTGTLPQKGGGRYRTGSPDLADFLQALLLSIGYRTYLVTRHLNGEREIRFSPTAWTDMDSSSVKQNMIYSGATWCVTAASGTIVTRRNGQVAITGNSIRSKDDFATTYILDSNITYLLKSAHDMIPRWFLEAIRTS